MSTLVDMGGANHIQALFVQPSIRRVPTFLSLGEYLHVLIHCHNVDSAAVLNKQTAYFPITFGEVFCEHSCYVVE